jgi:hypothetical protein
MINNNPLMLNAYGSQKKNLLHESVRLERQLCVKKLLQYKANPNCLDDNNNSPLHIGVQCNVPITIIEDLLKAGTNPNSHNHESKTAFDIACSQHSPVVEAFEPYGYLFFSSLRPYNNPFELLKKNGEHLKELANGPLGSYEWNLAADNLIKLFEHVNNATNTSVIPIERTAFINEYGFILKHASQKECQNIYNQETFSFAYKILVKKETLKDNLLTLVKNDDSINLQNILVNNTIGGPLQYKMLKTCIKKSKISCLLTCLNNKFSPNRYRKAISLLHYAIELNKPGIITILADHNADLTPLNNQEQTPLEYATSLKNQQCTDAMKKAITKRHRILITKKDGCGLVKHLLQKNPIQQYCEQCVDELLNQLTNHTHSSVK